MMHVDACVHTSKYSVHVVGPIIFTSTQRDTSFVTAMAIAKLFSYGDLMLVGEKGKANGMKLLPHISMQ